MAYEDYTTYTEVGDVHDGGEFAANHIALNLSTLADEFLYKDFGAGHFSGDFVHYVDVKISTTSGFIAYCAPWALSDVVDDCSYWNSNASQALYVSVKIHFTGQINIGLIDPKSGVSQWKTKTTTARLYLKIERVNKVVTAKFYTDAAHTALLETLTITQTTAYSYRYGFAVNNQRAGILQTFLGDVWNLDLGIVIPSGGQAVPRSHRSMSGYNLFVKTYVQHRLAGLAAIATPDGQNLL
jgi:hypothetical protein